MDQMSYLPGSAFGFAGLGGAGLPGAGRLDWVRHLAYRDRPALTGLGQSIANAFSTEADVNLTPRTSLTFVGGYSLLHYFDSGLLNFTDASFRGGYNYLLTRKDTIAVFYTYTRDSLQQLQSIDRRPHDSRVLREACHRTACFPNRSGPSNCAVSHADSSRFRIELEAEVVDKFLDAAVLVTEYEPAVSIRAHGTGSLVLPRCERGIGRAGGLCGRHCFRFGDAADVANFFERRDGGYSRNSGLAIAPTTPTSQTYDYWFAGASFSHPMGRTLGLTFSYQMQYQELEQFLLHWTDMRDERDTPRDLVWGGMARKAAFVLVRRRDTLGEETWQARRWRNDRA